MGWMRTHHMERGPAKPQARKKPQALPPLKRKPSAPLTPAEIAYVQRWLANGTAQASLKVSQPQDAQEIEADETAERVMRAPESAQLSADMEHAQRSPLPAGSKPDVAATASQLPSLRAEGGRSLPQSELEFMNARFRRNFGGVRIHTGPAAAALAEGVQAKAFTVGNDIVFGENQFQPGTTAGRKLLAHELTHTVQQNGQAKQIQRQPQPQGERARPGQRQVQLTERQIRMLTATVLAESINPAQDEGVKWIYYNRILTDGFERALKASSAYNKREQREGRWWRIWMGVLGDPGYRQSEWNRPSPGQSNRTVSQLVSTAWGQKHIVQRAAAIHQSVRGMLEGSVQNPYAGWIGQGNLKDFNLNDGKWIRARQYLFLFQKGEVTNRWVAEFPHANPDYYTLIFHEVAINDYFRRHPEKLPRTVPPYWP